MPATRGVRSLAAGLLLSAGLAVSAGGQTVRHVPGDYANIQSAINASSNGDTVLVGDGTWTGASNRALNTYGKSITVRSVNGPAATKINCGSLDRAFSISNGEGRDTVIQGFTIEYCSTATYGGGIYISGASATIRDCIFRNNLAEFYGGGLYVGSTTEQVLVDGCTFFNNQAYRRGGGLYGGSVRVVGSRFEANTASGTGDVPGDGGGAYLGAAEVWGCQFFVNSARRGGGLWIDGATIVRNALFVGNGANIPGVTLNQGGAIFVDGGGSGIHFATFSGNESLSGGDSIFLDGYDALVYSSILWDSNAPTAIGGTGTLTIHYSDVKQATGTYPGTDNLNSDPLFVTGPDGAYYLSQTAAGQGSTSPCVNTRPFFLASHYCDMGRGDVCLDRLTTRTDHAGDSSTADAGFHYGEPWVFGDDFESGRFDIWTTWAP